MILFGFILVFMVLMIIVYEVLYGRSFVGGAC